MRAVTPDKAVLLLMWEIQGVERNSRDPITEEEIQNKYKEKDPEGWEELDVNLELRVLEDFGFVEKVENKWSINQVGALLASQLEW